MALVLCKTRLPVPVSARKIASMCGRSILNGMHFSFMNPAVLGTSIFRGTPQACCLHALSSECSHGLLCRHYCTLIADFVLIAPSFSSLCLFWL